MTALIISGLFGAVLAAFGLMWYYRPKIAALEVVVNKAEAVGEALEDERAARTESDREHNVRTEVRWKAEIEEAALEAKIDAAWARWSRVRRSLRLPGEGDQGPR